MAGYEDTRQMIIDTLVGRMAGTEIQPEDHQKFALQITEYIRSVELVSGNATPIGFAGADTVPVQPDNGQAVYLSSVGGAQTITFSNFIDHNGNAISVTSTANVIKLVTLLWNGQYWSSQVTSVNTVRDTTDGYLFMGVATPLTDPGDPDQKVFYIASQTGTYANFNGIVLTNEVAILKYDTQWIKISTGIATISEISELKQKIDGKKLVIPTSVSDGSLSATGVYTPSSSLHHTVVDVRDFHGKKITTSNVTQYGFLKSYNVPAQSEFTEGGRITGTPVNVTIPDDAVYLYLYLGASTSIPRMGVTGETDGIETRLGNTENNVDRLTIELEGKNLPQPTQDDVLKGSINANGLLDSSATQNSIIIDIEKFQGETISASNGVYWGFLKSWNEKFAEYCTTRQSGKPTNQVVPNDCKYLYIYIGTDAQGNPIPQISVTGILPPIWEKTTQPPKMYVKKTSSAINIYVRLENGIYVCYPINKRYKEYVAGQVSFYDCWGIDPLFTCHFSNGDFTTDDYLFRSGENELALRVKDSSDSYVYVGGKAHGFENMISDTYGRHIRLLIDGNYIGEDDTYNGECNAVSLEMGTNFYVADTNTNPFAESNKKWSFHDGIVELFNNVKFLRSVEISNAQFGMMCVFRRLNGTSSEPYLTRYAFGDKSPYRKRIIEDGWGDNAQIGKNEIIEFGDCNLSFAMIVVDDNRQPHGTMVLGTNSSTYNKMYFDFVNDSNGVTPSVGDVWYSKIRWEIHSFNDN